MTRPAPSSSTAADPTADHPPGDTEALRRRCGGLPPLSARLEPWMRELLADRGACSALIEEYGSPVNVHEFSALARNASELESAAARHGVPLRIFVARKANKTLGLVESARRAGHGVDVGSHRELSQVLDQGYAPEDVVVTAAVKPPELLRLARDTGVVLVLDNLDEAEAFLQVAAENTTGGPQPVALRLAPTPASGVAPTRFGESAATWQHWADHARTSAAGLRIDGVHFHLHGYAAQHRALALDEALRLGDALRDLGHDLRFIDIGGGVPMSYLDDAGQWDAFWTAHDASTSDRVDAVTWRGEPLRQVYPYHQEPVRGEWLEQVLGTRLPTGETAAVALRERGLELRCEPGRSLLDGCGLTLSRVVQRTTTSDGVPLVGLEMNRTQCRSTSDDFLVDPLLVPGDGPRSAPLHAFLVGAYCIEAELILRRRLDFPEGVAIGDLLAFPNTAGYLMHILESASHQIPLASNVVLGPRGPRRDAIDAVSPLRPWAQESAPAAERATGSAAAD